VTACSNHQRPSPHKNKTQSVQQQTVTTPRIAATTIDTAPATHKSKSDIPNQILKMDLSSPHLLRDFLGALLSLAVDFYNFAVGILATILSSFIRACNSLGNFIMARTETFISEGGLKFFTDSAKFLPALITPATLIAVLFVLTHSREGYDGIYPLSIIYLLFLISF
jgi:hypothetical protein